MLPLHVMLLPARGPRREREPLVFFNGGPGAPTIDYANYASWALSSLRDTHDLLLVDMRGTGEPAPLACDLYDDHGRLAPFLAPYWPLDRVRACAARLSKRFDLTQYTTEAAARDFDAVRAALHIDQIDLYGASYGTRLGLEYMRLFPEHVHRAVLLGVIPPEAPTGRDFAVGGEHALQAAFAACAVNRRCHDAAPDPRADIVAMLGRLRSSPATRRLWNWRRLSMERVTLTAPAFAEALFIDSYSPGTLVDVLPMVHRALSTGDYTALVRHFIRTARSRRANRSEGLMISVICTEDAPRLSLADAHESDTVLGLPTIHNFLAACDVWPRGKFSPAFGRRVISDIPTLLMSGGLDPASPPNLADSAALGLSRHEQYLDPWEGHASLDDRARARIVEFIARP
jgi:pimeloyl-ACP methyl ester carboxylesterase